MKLTAKFLAATLLALLAGRESPAVDYAKIDRTIAKEPTYATASPRYALVVIGAEAKTRVWIALDGDTLYLDRNSNGDLTEDGERHAAKDASFDTIQDADAVLGRLKLSVSTAGRDGPGFSILYEAVGKYMQAVHSTPFAATKADAPIVHLDGPLTMGLHHTSLQKDARGELRLCAWIGNANFGKDVRPTMIDFNRYGERFPGVPKGIDPVATIEFPHKDEGGKPIVVQARLTDRE